MTCRVCHVIHKYICMQGKLFMQNQITEELGQINIF